jgi:hypothetical protein
VEKENPISVRSQGGARRVPLTSLEMQRFTRMPVMNNRWSMHAAWRIPLHLFCLLHKRHVRWHWGAIARDLRLTSLFPSL